MSEYICGKCGYIYSEEDGCEEAFEAEIDKELVEGFIRNQDEKCSFMGAAPGTKWEDVPKDFKCPQCGSPKDRYKRK